MRGMIITVLHCRERKKRRSEGETGREKGEGKGHGVEGKGGKCGSRKEGVKKVGRGENEQRRA